MNPQVMNGYVSVVLAGSWNWLERKVSELLASKVWRKVDIEPYQSNRVLLTLDEEKYIVQMGAK